MRFVLQDDRMSSRTPSVADVHGVAGIFGSLRVLGLMTRPHTWGWAATLFVAGLALSNLGW